LRRGLTVKPEQNTGGSSPARTPAKPHRSISQNLLDHPEIEDESDDLEFRATERTEHGIDLEYLANEPSTGDAASLSPAINIVIPVPVEDRDFLSFDLSLTRVRDV